MGERTIITMLFIGLFMIYFPVTNKVYAEDKETCSITIDANIHVGGVYAEASGKCKGHVAGTSYISGNFPAFKITGVIERHVSDGNMEDLTINGRGYVLRVTTIMPNTNDESNEEPVKEPEQPKENDPEPDEKEEPKQNKPESNSSKNDKSKGDEKQSQKNDTSEDINKNQNESSSNSDTKENIEPEIENVDEELDKNESATDDEDNEHNDLEIREKELPEEHDVSNFEFGYEKINFVSIDDAINKKVEDKAEEASSLSNDSYKNNSKNTKAYVFIVGIVIIWAGLFFFHRRKKAR